MNKQAETYFSAISNLLQTMQVTTQGNADQSVDEGIAGVIQIIEKLRRNAGKVMVIGNGGSAAIANHMHNDLCKALKVRALTFYESSVLTAYANDDGYESAFKQSVELWADKGDLLIAISSSGQSENILRAARLAIEHGCSVVTLSGFHPDNPLRKLGHFNFYVASAEYGFVESAHANLTHFITDAVLMAQAKHN